MNKLLAWAGVIAAIGAGYYWLSGKPKAVPVVIEVVQPDLSALAAKGEAAFVGTCAACHGVQLAGTENGPPLVHVAYRTVFHADFAIVSAIKNGVPSHHWRFGSMPPQPDIAEDEIEPIIAYIREMQRANGIR